MSKKIFVVVSFILFFSCCLFSTPINYIKVDTTTWRGTMYHNGDILMYDSTTTITTNFEIKYGSITKCRSISAEIIQGTMVYSSGGIGLKNTDEETAGMIRWTGTNFEGYNGSEWKTLDVSSLSGGGWTEDEVNKKIYTTNADRVVIISSLTAIPGKNEIDITTNVKITGNLEVQNFLNIPTLFFSYDVGDSTISYIDIEGLDGDADVRYSFYIRIVSSCTTETKYYLFLSTGGGYDAGKVWYAHRIITSSSSVINSEWTGITPGYMGFLIGRVTGMRQSIYCIGDLYLRSAYETPVEWQARSFNYDLAEMKDIYASNDRKMSGGLGRNNIVKIRISDSVEGKTIGAGSYVEVYRTKR